MVESEVGLTDFQEIVDSKDRLLAEADILRASIVRFMEERGLKTVGLDRKVTPEQFAGDSSISDLVRTVIQMEIIRK